MEVTDRIDFDAQFAFNVEGVVVALTHALQQQASDDNGRAAHAKPRRRGLRSVLRVPDEEANRP